VKKSSLCLILIFLLFPLVSESDEHIYDKQNDKINKYQKVFDDVYSEIILEDFEKTVYSDTNLKLMPPGGECVPEISDQYPAPVNDSKKYLGLKIYAKRADTFRIELAKPIEITKYCKTISMWVYGEKIAGDLYVMIQDTAGTDHLINFGQIASNGWKKISRNLGTKIKQQIDFLGSNNSIKILYIQYRATNKKFHQWQYFYIDDITATVRDKYIDRENDDW
jgi:hypothetical protein